MRRCAHAAEASCLTVAFFASRHAVKVWRGVRPKLWVFLASSA